MVIQRACLGVLMTGSEEEVVRTMDVGGGGEGNEGREDTCYYCV